MRLPRRADDPDFFLRRVLQLNAAFSALSGLLWVAGGAALGRWFGRDGSMATDGFGLIVFAALIALLASRPRIPLPVALGVVVMDVLWALDALAGVASGAFSSAGGWTMALIALAVLDFAAFQAIGIHHSRLQRAAVRS